MDIPKEFLSKEFLSQFKTGEDVTAFMKSFILVSMSKCWKLNLITT